MRKAENKNAPMLSGWIIAVAAGLVAFGALIAVGKLDLVPSAALSGVVVLIVGLILGMPWGAEAAPMPAAASVAKAAPAAAASVAKAVPVAAAPAAAPVVKPDAAPAAPAPQPAAVMAAPEAKPATAGGPTRLAAARDGKGDDLKEIEGIGPAMEKLVNSLGFFHFDQIASWSDADVAVVDAEMKSFKGRIARDKWVAQAKLIVSEGLEAFRERAKTNNY